DYFLASSNRRQARVGLKTPQLQKRASVADACCGERLPCFTHSTSLRTKLDESMPWPHMVASSSVWRSAMRSVCPKKPSEYSTLWRSRPGAPRALLSFVERTADVDRQSEICFLQLADEGHDRIRVI